MPAPASPRTFALIFSAKQSAGLDEVGLPGSNRDVSKKMPLSVSSYTGSTTADANGPIP